MLEEAIRDVGRAFDLLRVAANSDDKTPLRNAMAFRSRLGAIRAEAESFLVFGDLNGFKAVNDTYGHAAGDAAIHRAGSTLAHSLEPYDAEAFRQSGDEFVILGREIHREQILAALKAAFQRVDVLFDTNLFEIRMSFGWTPVTEDEPEKWLERAEVACIAAKHEGAGACVKWTDTTGDTVNQAYRGRCTACNSSFGCTPSTPNLLPNELYCPCCGKTGTLGTND